MRAQTAFLLVAAFLATVGCDEGGSSPSARYAASRAPAEAAAGYVVSADAYDGAPPGLMGAAGGVDKERAAAPAEAAAEPAVSRKIIYDATLDLAVDDLDAAVAKVGDLIASSGGYVAEETMTGSPGSTRSLFWKLRVPIDGFDGFVKSVMALGELVRFNRTSQDVTAEFYDVEARIANKQVQEKTLQKMLEERSGQLEEVLKVETELSRVRGDIEQLQGRLRVLRNLTSLATLTLTIRERERFQPPAPAVADFPTQIARTWGESVAQLTDMGKATVLFVVARVLWLPFYAVGLWLLWAVGRRVVAAALAFERPRPTPPTNTSPGD